MMKSIVEVEINKPQQEVAKLFADPANNPKWMYDLKRYEPVSGDQENPGFTYRLIPKKGNMIFLATIIEKNPDELKLDLEASNVHVSITGKLKALSPVRTKLISEEVFTFKGFFNSIFGLFAGKAIKSVHRRHIKDFKEFAESDGR
jgi:hypothetical protein